MSGKIKLNSASGGGSVSIQAPSSESNNRTLTLPSDADGTIVSKDASNNVAEVASINGGSIGTNNLVTNGNMAVSQRGTSSTSVGILVDGFNVNFSGTDEAVTHAQVDVNSSDSGDNPFAKGITKALKLTNGNQTSGAGAADRVRFLTVLEARDVRNSGWNYTSTSSFVTLSFYVKSSVSQNFYLRLTSADGTGQSYVMETGTLTANTWTRVTKTIPGNSNLQFDDNSAHGLYIVIVPFRGTDNTGTRPLNAWAAFDAANMYPDMASTWYTTNDATFEVTGVQLEVGSTASAFVHETFADTLRKCQRYLFILDLGTDSNAISIMLHRRNYSNGIPYGYLQFMVPMRDNPSMTKEGTSYTGTGYQTSITLSKSVTTGVSFYGSNTTNSGETSFHRVDTAGGSSLKYLFSAEL